MKWPSGGVRYGQNSDDHKARSTWDSFKGRLSSMKKLSQLADLPTA